MTVWFEFEYAISGETFTVQVRYYVSDVAPNPIVTDEWRYRLTTNPVTVGTLKARLYDRVREIEAGLQRYNAIDSALSSSQNTRLSAEDVVG